MSGVIYDFENCSLQNLDDELTGKYSISDKTTCQTGGGGGGGGGLSSKKKPNSKATSYK